MRPLDTGEFWDETRPTPDRALKRSGRRPLRANTRSPALSAFEPKAAPHRRFDLRAAGWLTIGFMSGVVSWHVIGFWGFVTETVLHEQAASPIAVAHTTSVPEGASPIVTGSIAVAAPEPLPACVALVNRHPSGGTVAAPCAEAARPLRDAGRNPRADRLPGAQERLQSSNAWPATANTEQAGLPVRSNGSFDEVDLNLSPPD